MLQNSRHLYHIYHLLAEKSHEKSIYRSIYRSLVETGVGKHTIVALKIHWWIRLRGCRSTERNCFTKIGGNQMPQGALSGKMFWLCQLFSNHSNLISSSTNKKYMIPFPKNRCQMSSGHVGWNIPYSTSTSFGVSVAGSSQKLGRILPKDMTDVILTVFSRRNNHQKHKNAVLRSAQTNVWTAFFSTWQNHSKTSPSSKTPPWLRVFLGFLGTHGRTAALQRLSMA